MRLYHGSTIDIQSVDLAKSKPNKDFGRAFQYAFCTQRAIDKLMKVV
jgi:hypothetical protein